MDDTPFHRIILPALVVASAGFAALAWPLTADHSARLSQRLPQPFDRWVDSALMTHQHKEFSIRYIGFAILSSVTIGVGTAGAMRRQQSRVQRHQGLLNQVLTAARATGDRHPRRQRLCRLGAPARPCWPREPLAGAG